MRTFVVKLAGWHRVYKDLEAARLRLAQAEAAQLCDARDVKIREEVDRLQRTCDLALGELRAAADACIAAGQQVDSTPFENQPPSLDHHWQVAWQLSSDKSGARRVDSTVV